MKKLIKTIYDMHRDSFTIHAVEFIEEEKPIDQFGYFTAKNVITKCQKEITIGTGIERTKDEITCDTCKLIMGSN